MIKSKAKGKPKKDKELPLAEKYGICPALTALNLYRPAHNSLGEKLGLKTLCSGRSTNELLQGLHIQKQTAKAKKTKAWIQEEMLYRLLPMIAKITTQRATEYMRSQGKAFIAALDREEMLQECMVALLVFFQKNALSMDNVEAAASKVCRDTCTNIFRKLPIVSAVGAAGLKTVSEEADKTAMVTAQGFVACTNFNDAGMCEQLESIVSSERERFTHRLLGKSTGIITPCQRTALHLWYFKDEMQIKKCDKVHRFNGLNNIRRYMDDNREVKQAAKELLY